MLHSSNVDTWLALCYRRDHILLGTDSELRDWSRKFLYITQHSTLAVSLIVLLPVQARWLLIVINLENDWWLQGFLPFPPQIEDVDVEDWWSELNQCQWHSRSNMPMEQNVIAQIFLWSHLGQINQSSPICWCFHLLLIRGFMKTRLLFYNVIMNADHTCSILMVTW